MRIAEVREVVPDVGSRHLVLLEPWRRAELAPRYGGQIAELLIVEQSEVKAGDLLVRLVDADARGSLMSAQASRSGSEKRLDDLDRQLADARELLGDAAFGLSQYGYSQQVDSTENSSGYAYVVGLDLR